MYIIMKKIILLLLLLLAGNNVFAQLIPKVDERIELASIVFCLAGAPEYSVNEIPSYAEDIDSYFAEYKDHPVVKFAKEVRKEYAVSYGDPMASALFSEIGKRGVGLASGLTDEEIEKTRWTAKDLKKYYKLLDDFYKETKFREFFDSHRELYGIAEERMSAMFQNKFNADWFESFYGKPLGEIYIYIGMANGPSNYAFQDLQYGNGIIIGAGRQAADGLPDFSGNIIFAVIHEIGHLFSNDLFMKHWNEIEPAADIIYPYIKEDMYFKAYGDPITSMLEWFNNLCVLMYFKDNSSPESGDLNIYTVQMMFSGFLWMERSVSFMENFYSNRELYPYIESFMPQLISFLNYTAHDFDKILEEALKVYPYVVEVFPAIGSSVYDIIDVGEIRITFSEPMSTFMFGVSPVENKEPIFALLGQPEWIDDYTLVFPVNSDKRDIIKSDVEYAFALNNLFFKSKKSYPMEVPFVISYNTYK